MKRMPNIIMDASKGRDEILGLMSSIGISTLYPLTVFGLIPYCVVEMKRPI